MRTAILIGLAAAGSGALISWSEFTESGRVDTCLVQTCRDQTRLDQGGRWVYEQGRCEGSRSSP